MNDRTKELLDLIIKDYVETGIPIGSKKLIEKNDLKWSPALIRNEMAMLEKDGFLAKPHTSGGRIPTNKAYKLYSTGSKELEIVTEREVSKYIDDIFKKRELNIENLINETVKVLSKATNLVAIATEKHDKEEMLANITLTQTQDIMAVLLIVTNKNRVINSVIQLPTSSKIDNLITSVDIFNERLKGTKLSEIESKALLMKDIILSKIKDVDFDFKSFVTLMFKNLMETKSIQHGIGNIIRYNELNDKKETFEKILKIIDENTVWDLIKTTNHGKSNITIGLEKGEDISIINKDIKIKGKKHSIALLGPTRVDHIKVKKILELVSKKIEEL